MLTGEQISALGLLSNTNAESFRGASYDVRVGSIIKPDSEVVSQFKIPPQGIVEVVSKERIKLPNNICGFAAVKTGLSTKGLLALNIGLIDPLYDGPVASFLLNFSKVDILIEEGDVFLRTYFVEMASSTKKAKKVSISDKTYLRDKKKNIIQFADTFLNVDKFVAEIVKEYALKGLVFVGAVALIVTFSSYLATTASVNTLRGWIDPNASIQEDIKKEQAEAASARVEAARLRREISSLSRCLDQARNAPPNQRPVHC
jgi:deoxycytidine triphosphate deaminase